MNTHALIHLSKSQWKRLQPNSIHLTGKQVTSGRCLYNTIVYGENIKKHIGSKKTLQPHNVTVSQANLIMLENVKRGVVVITTSMQELADDIDACRLFTVDSTYRTATNDYIDKKYQPSEVIVLGLVTLNKEYDGIIEWSSSHRDLMKKHKQSVITSEGKHHGSAGEYYSYGNKANFGMVELSSVAQYASRSRGMDSHLKGICLEELSAMEMQMGINELQKYIPLLPKLISPFIATAFRLQNKIGDINLKKTTVSKDGLWQTCMCIGYTNFIQKMTAHIL